jgi:hypothetical protein
MRINPRSFWTQNELGSTQISIVLGDRKPRSPRHARVTGKGFDTCPPLRVVRGLSEVCVNFNIARAFRSLKRGEERKLPVYKPQRNCGETGVVGCRVDGVDMNAERKERSQFAEPKRPVGIVHDDVELLCREKRRLTPELFEVVSIDEHPIPMSGGGIGKQFPPGIAGVIDPVA